VAPNLVDASGLIIEAIEPRRPHPAPRTEKRVVPWGDTELAVARVVPDERDLGSHLARRPRHAWQPELAAISTVRVDPHHVAGRVEARSAGERHIQMGRVGPDAQYERVAAGEHRERPPHGWAAPGRGRRAGRRGRLPTPDAVVLLRLLDVVPRPTPPRRQL